MAPLRALQGDVSVTTCYFKPCREDVPSFGSERDGNTYGTHTATFFNLHNAQGCRLWRMVFLKKCKMLDALGLDWGRIAFSTTTVQYLSGFVSGQRRTFDCCPNKQWNHSGVGFNRTKQLVRDLLLFADEGLGGCSRCPTNQIPARSSEGGTV